MPLLGETIDLKTTLLLVLRKSLVHVGLMRGFHEGAKVIEKHAAQLCVLAEVCNQLHCIKFICVDRNVSLVSVFRKRKLILKGKQGRWSVAFCVVVKN